MIGSFLTRGLVMVFGYAYPAYECYKTVEKNKLEIEQLRFWCQYWILVAVLTVCERIGDAFISWVPMYSEAKLAFFIYLWYPKTKGTTYVYDSFFRPYVAMHENDIDRNLLELRTRAGDMAVLYWQRAASYGQTRVFEILQYVASQSTPRPQPQGARARQGPTVPNRQPPNSPIRQPSTAAQPQIEEPPSPTSSTSSSQHQMEVVEEVGPSRVPPAVPPAAPTAALNSSKSIVASETKGQSTINEAEAKQIEAVPSSANENADPATEETIMDETIRVTRGRLRKARSAGTR
ncbi:HVA22-like protein i [Tripterygium wilfordii]|uniref:HVA22-like protein n=1 Tax=Tripterygium wilfordii TaxID=458696 RepID=A0A7J7CZU9_TRIWF|nr:putative HVA22-like protein g [Tripterygium wilfordii]KAF5739346.1 HVA22-like protein i [Tripterygium wilfordii]